MHADKLLVFNRRLFAFIGVILVLPSGSGCGSDGQRPEWLLGSGRRVPKIDADFPRFVPFEAHEFQCTYGKRRPSRPIDRELAGFLLTLGV